MIRSLEATKEIFWNGRRPQGSVQHRLWLAADTKKSRDTNVIPGIFLQFYLFTAGNRHRSGADMAGNA